MNLTHLLQSSVFVVALSAAVSCSKSKGGPPDAGIVDVCNIPSDALTPACQLLQGTSVTAYVSHASEQDWYGFKLPADTTARTLVHITAGYGVASSPVNLSVTAYAADGKTILAQGIDRHGAGQPRPVDLLFNYAQPNGQVYILISDDLSDNPSAFDFKNPYSIQVALAEDPDPNEGNDPTPTPIVLSPQAGGFSEGLQSGFLATSGDVDEFSVSVSNQNLLYVHLTAPAVTPPPPYRLSYNLLDPQGNNVSSGVVANSFIAVDLATARRVSSGTYLIQVQAFEDPALGGPPPGSLTYQYGLDVRLMNSLDTNEPNNDVGHAKNISLPSLAAASDALPTVSQVGSGQSITGRLDAVPDPDWFSLTLGAYGGPSILYYHLVPSGTAGRFPPIPGTIDRQLRLFQPVAGTAACNTVSANDLVGCPKNSGNLFGFNLVTTYCGLTPPLCMLSSRQEYLTFANLRNLEGAIQVPSHGSPVTYNLLFEDLGNNWADDSPYTLLAQWRKDGNEPGVNQLVTAPLAYDSVGAGYPVPNASSTKLTGAMSYGFGLNQNLNSNAGQGVHGSNDYDAQVSETGHFHLTFPTPSQPPFLDRTLALQWSVTNASYNLDLTFQFCDGSLGGACTPVNTTRGGSPFSLTYIPGNFLTWANQSFTNAAVSPMPVVQNNNNVFTVTPYACLCMEPRFMQGGYLDVAVSTVDRTDYQPSNYAVNIALTPYPPATPTSLPDGGTFNCPLRVLDGGGSTTSGGCAISTFP